MVGCCVGVLLFTSLGLKHCNVLASSVTVKLTQSTQPKVGHGLIRLYKEKGRLVVRTLAFTRYCYYQYCMVYSI